MPSYSGRVSLGGCSYTKGGGGITASDKQPLTLTQNPARAFTRNAVYDPSEGIVFLRDRADRFVNLIDLGKRVPFQIQSDLEALGGVPKWVLHENGTIVWYSDTAHASAVALGQVEDIFGNLSGLRFGPDVGLAWDAFGSGALDLSCVKTLMPREQYIPMLNSAGAKLRDDNGIILRPQQRQEMLAVALNDPSKDTGTLIPAGAYLFAVAWNVNVEMPGAGITMDIGIAADPTRFAAAINPHSPATSGVKWLPAEYTVDTPNRVTFSAPSAGAMSMNVVAFYWLMQEPPSF